MRDVKDLLAELAVKAPDRPAPLGELLRDGSRAIRRRRATVAGVMSTVVLVAAGGLTLDQLRPSPSAHRFADGQSPSSPVTTAPPPTTGRPAAPTPPAGTRYVGLGTAVIAVPLAWKNQQEACQPPATPFVAFETSTSGVCTAPPGDDGLGVTIGPGGVTISEFIPGSGLPAQDLSCYNATRCAQMLIIGRTRFEIGVFGANAATVVRAVASSARSLPPGFTTVPFPDVRPYLPNSKDPKQQLARARTLLADAGLRYQIATDEASDLPSGWVAGFSLEAGSIVDTGTVVKIRVASGIDGGELTAEQADLAVAVAQAQAIQDGATAVEKISAVVRDGVVKSTTNAGPDCDSGHYIEVYAYADFATAPGSTSAPVGPMSTVAERYRIDAGTGLLCQNSIIPSSGLSAAVDPEAQVIFPE